MLKSRGLGKGGPPLAPAPTRLLSGPSCGRFDDALLFLRRCDDDVYPSAESAATKSVLVASDPQLWWASSSGQLPPLAAPNMNKLLEAERARALRRDGCANG